jgi:riboflavin transporter FmnP
MNTKEIAIIAAFTALVTALNFIKIPVPYLPTFSYQIGDIALVVALLLFGIKPGIVIAFLSMIINILIIPGPAGIVGPPYYFVAVLSMLFGVHLSVGIVIKKKILQTSSNSMVALLIITVISRVLIMLPLDYFIYGALVSFVSGLSLSTSYALVIASMPAIILYNLTVPLYVIPTSYIISKKISRTLKLSNFQLTKYPFQNSDNLPKLKSNA